MISNGGACEGFAGKPTNSNGDEHGGAMLVLHLAGRVEKIKKRHNAGMDFSHQGMRF